MTNKATETVIQCSPLLSEADSLQALLNAEKEKGLVDVKYFCSPDQDQSPDEFYTGARKMMTRHLTGASTEATDI